MSIGFKTIPANLRTTLFFAELDASNSNLGQPVTRALLIGQMTLSGAGALIPNVPVICQGVAWAKAFAGQGSQLALMVEQYRARDSFGEMWVLPLADNGSGVAASGSILVTSAATAAGTLNLYIAGQLVQVNVSPTMTTAQLATAIQAAIAANTDLPVLATVSSSTVTLTAKNKGLGGNDIDIRANYRGGPGGEAFPTGYAHTITAMSGGTTNPILTTALAGLGSTLFDFIGFPYTDSGSLDALKAFLADRWSWDSMLYGGAFGAARGTLGTLTTLGAARNDPHVAIMGFNDSPTPNWLWAADLTAACAESLRVDPALPLQTVALGVLAPPIQSRFAITDRNALLFSGIGTHNVDDDGTVRIDNLITTYQFDANGQADDSLLEVERLFTIAYIIRDLKSFVLSTYGRMKLADDGTNFRPGASIVTPSIIRDGIVGRYRLLERNGIAQDSDAFKANLIVQRNSGNRCRVDGLLPIVPIDQLRQFAALVQPRNAAQIGA